MHSEKKKTVEDIMKTNADITKRTTIILDKEEREFVNSLIANGKEPGIKPLISKMLDIYKNMMIYDWRYPGEYYYGISRTAFVNSELMDILINQIPKENWRAIGKTMGNALKVSMETTLELQTSNQENWGSFLKRLRAQGLGELYVKDKYILIKTPFINHAEIWAGLLESLLGTELEVTTSGTLIVLEIRKEATPKSANDKN